MADEERKELGILLAQHEQYALGYNVRVLYSHRRSKWRVEDANGEWHPQDGMVLGGLQHDTFWGAYDQGKKYLEGRGQTIHR